MAARNEPVAGRDDLALTITLVFDAPPSLYRMWTERQHVFHWPAPRGFAVTYSEADMRPGGVVAGNVHIDAPLFKIGFAPIFDVLVWLGLFQRDPRLRALPPLTRAM